jgi:hypothetical protein
VPRGSTGHTLELEIEAQTPALRSGLETRDYTLEIEFCFPSYALFKERVGAFRRGRTDVELIGIEPTTPSLQSWCSPS